MDPHSATQNSTPKDKESEVVKQGTMKIDIISTEHIKPLSPTPHHLKTYKISSLDQLIQTTPIDFIFFYSNPENKDYNAVISDRLPQLKQSLSEILTRFYPFAGKIKDNISIDCNDEGVYYVEARVNYRLSDFLSPICFQLIKRLIPEKPESVELISGIYVMRIQVNIFDCGGIVISMSTSHRLADGQTCATFFKTWAATNSGYLQIEPPSFIAPSLFPPNPLLSSFPSMAVMDDKFCTRRFVIDASSISKLKEKLSGHPTRVQAVIALIWKCLTVACRTRNSSSSTDKPSVLGVVVNLRRKSSPPLQEQCVGNIIWSAVAKLMPDADTALDLSYVVGRVAGAIREIDHNFVDEIKGDRGYLKIIELIKKLGEQLPSDREFDLFGVTSTVNFGLYEADFGWGKPAWFHFFNPGLKNSVVLTDTRPGGGGGIEACVTLSEEDMTVFEHDPELLEFASTDRNNPLRF